MAQRVYGDFKLSNVSRAPFQNTVSVRLRLEHLLGQGVLSDIAEPIACHHQHHKTVKQLGQHLVTTEG